MKTSNRAVLFPSHFPWAPKVRVSGMSSKEITVEQRKVLNEVCLSIFADMSNAQAPLVEILCACYMSGVENTLSILDGNYDSSIQEVVENELDKSLKERDNIIPESDHQPWD